MSTKRTLTRLAVVSLTAIALGACGGKKKEEGGHQVLVWVAEEVLETTKTQLNSFKEKLKNDYGYTVNYTVNPQSEQKAASQIISDMESGADIYCFAQNQLAALNRAGALDRLSDNRAAKAAEKNDAASVEAAKVSGSNKMRAYPLTSDNGYFMYYDKRVVKQEHLGDLSQIIADCNAANKFVSMEYESGWYTYAFFSGAGCVSEWTANEDGNFIAYNDTYNSANGLKGIKGLKELIHTSTIVNSDSAADFASGSAVVISGTWDYSTAKANLGENLGSAPLPSFTVGSDTYHLGSFYGSKLMGVKPQTDADKAAICHMTAEYLTDYDAQVERFNKNGWGPCNKQAQALDAVKNAEHLLALKAQNEHGTLQGQYPEAWWPIADAIGADVRKAGAASTDAQLQKILSDYAASIADLIQ